MPNKWTRLERKRHRQENPKRPAASVQGKDRFAEWNETKREFKRTYLERKRQAGRVASRLLGEKKEAWDWK